MSTEELSLYAVEIELWQIDNSKPAVRFNVLSQPTELARRATAVKAAGAMTDARKLQFEFWTMFRSRLLEQKVLSSAQAPRPQYWFNVSLGRSNIHLSCIADTYSGRIGIRVYLRSKIADTALVQLQADRKAIESEIGAEVIWNPNPNKLDKVILLDREADLDDRSKWDEYISWLVDKVGKFKKAFGPRVLKLNLLDDGAADPPEVQA
jgi:hypothetical protein